MSVRVLVVDDSAFARKVIREVLGAVPGIEVVGFARDGLEALEQIEALAPEQGRVPSARAPRETEYARELAGAGD
jgi:CheY-like chemotaxis protein